MDVPGLASLVAHAGAPPLVHVHHPHHPASALAPALPPRCIVARLDAVEHHTARLLYAGIISRVSASLGRRGAGIETRRDPGGDGREVLSWDAFAHALRAVWAGRAGSDRKGKGKAKETPRKNSTASAKGTPRKDSKGKQRAGEDEEDNVEGHVVLVITKAERLKGVLGASWTAMTRLSELVGIPATVVLCSQMPWDDMRPARADAPEPILLYLEPMRRDQILAKLAPGSEHPVYPRFLDLLLATLGHLVPTSPPAEIDYVAGALWPLYTATLPAHAEMTLLGRAYPDPANPPPPLTVSVKLLTDLKHQLSLALAAAVESVLPRTTGRAEFTRALMPLSAVDVGVPAPSARTVPRPPPLELPLAARYILVAAYCVSYNPAKTDVRLFGRGTGPDGKRRRGGAIRRAGYGRARVGKVPQRLLGPRPFPLDRLLAMFASLYAEHAKRPEDLTPDDDDDSDDNDDSDEWPSVEAAADRARRKREREVERDERWEDEVDHLAFSAKLWALIPELEGQGLLKRSSPVDRLDNVMLRCEIDYETAKGIAKELRIALDEYLYEAAT